MLFRSNVFALETQVERLAIECFVIGGVLRIEKTHVSDQPLSHDTVVAVEAPALSPAVEDFLVDLARSDMLDQIGSAPRRERR